MSLSCDSSCHRDALLASDAAACFSCLSEFRPAAIKYWCDDGMTALCPSCGLDFVLGFSGEIDRAYLREAHDAQFPWRLRDS